MTSTAEVTFYADAVLFDMDGTLTDSIAAVEAAWTKVAQDIGQDPAFVIAATHGRRAVDNLTHFKPHIQAHEMEREVQAFEESILFFADAHVNHGPACHPPKQSSSPVRSDVTTPALTPGSSNPGSQASSRAGSFVSTLVSQLSNPAIREADIAALENPIADDDDSDSEAQKPAPAAKLSALVREEHLLEAWQIEAAAVDRSVRILPGVKRVMDSIPEGRYAVATSGARTYAYGCMTRVGITPPAVTITACDPRLKAGKPAPDPFLLAARELGFAPTRCVVFEDSPSGIRAGLAAGAVVIALCTSHPRAQVEGCGAHFVVDTMEQVVVVAEGEGEEVRLKFTVTLDVGEKTQGMVEGEGSVQPCQSFNELVRTPVMVAA
ncbi:HAD-like domain-containing protein [Trametes meyenii]|nr:HAD-like domain-containing protein [Trametes meyenii]